MGFDLEALIFLEDANGNPIGQQNELLYEPATDSPLLSYCFWSRVSVDGNLEATRRPVTGGTHKVIVPQQYIYTASIDNMFLKEVELNQNNLFNRSVRLRILTQLYAPRYGGPWRSGRVVKILKHAVGQSWREQSQENGIVQGSAIFWAEECIDGASQ